MMLLLAQTNGQTITWHSALISNNGDVKTFGRNVECQLGLGSSTTPYNSPQNTGITNAVAVASGGEHQLALLDDGSVLAWGYNFHGECGVSSAPPFYRVCTPVAVSLPGCATAISAGSGFSMALLADGTIWTWGRDNVGQLGNSVGDNTAPVPVQVSGISTAIAISAGAAHAMALLKDGTVRAWGDGQNGQVGNGSIVNQWTPKQVITTSGNLTNVVKIDAGALHNIALRSDNTVYTWGFSHQGRLGIGAFSPPYRVPYATQSSGFSGGTIIDVAAGYAHSMILQNNGNTKVCGHTDGDAFGVCNLSGFYVTPIAGPMIPGAVDIRIPPSARYGHVVKSNGQIYGWGENDDGAVGVGSTSNEVCPMQLITGLAKPSSDNHPQPCCVSILEDDRTEIEDGTTINSGIVTYTGNYALQGTLTLNGGTLNFNAADVICEPDAKIIVNGGWLNITGGSHLYACSTMWDGIEVKNGAIIIVNDESIIEDAETAVDMEYGVGYLIDEAIFNRNYKHIYKHMPSSGTPSWTGDYRITNSQFLCQTTASIGSTPVHENLLIPHENDITLMQIQAVGVPKLLVGSSGNGNVFDNASWLGVSTSGVSRVEVLYNDFTEAGLGATYVANGPGNGGETIDINYNTYAKCQFPIFCYDNDTTVRGHITYNTIDFDGMDSPPDFMTGITVQETTPASVVGTFNYWDISHDTIRNAPCGIHVSNMLGNRLSPGAYLYVGDNVITHKKNGSNWQAGITSDNVTEIAIANNIISHPTGAKHWWTTSIRITGGSHNAVTCNETYDHGRAIMTYNDLRPNTDFVKNEMTDYEVGFHMKNSKIGDQVDATTGKPNDNQWISPWGLDYHTWCEGTGSVGNLSQFTVRNTGSTYYPANRHASNGGSLVPAPTTTSLTGPSGCVYTGPAFKTDGSEAAAFSPIADELNIIEEAASTLTEIEEATNWNAQFNLYTALRRDSEPLYAEEETLQAFATEQQEGNIGILHRAMAEVNGNDAVNAETRVALQSLEPTNRPEQTLKQVLQILLAQEEQISENQETLLRKVAQRCPIDDGFGVYIARATLLKIDTLAVPYSSDCERVSSLEEVAHKQLSDEESEFRIYPNPTEELINVSYQLEEGQEGLLSVYTSTGGLVYSGRLEIGLTKTQIALNGISSGLYLITIDVDGNREHSQRISVLR